MKCTIKEKIPKVYKCQNQTDVKKYINQIFSVRLTDF